MASIGHLRARRSAAQLQALAGVEREIRANDHNGSRKYLRDFAAAFSGYESILDPSQVQAAVRDVDVVLVGDYHALPGCQRYAGELLERSAMTGDRPVVLGVETIFARDQHLLDEWWRREVEPEELRERMRFDREWGYDWIPFYELLVTAREHGEAIYGLDCAPREDLRKIGARDRHAAEKIAEIRGRHPNALILVLFGESHLAPGHLPLALAESSPGARVLTILQNVDALYWRVAGEQHEQVPAVRVSPEVLCVFNASPLEKYEHYRLCLERWRQEDASEPDLGPTMNNLIDGLAGFLGINRYSSHNRTQPRFLVDLLPEVYGPGSEATLRRLLSRRGLGEDARTSLLAEIERSGCLYVPSLNAICAVEFRMEAATEAATRFLHHACRALPERENRKPSQNGVDLFYRTVIEDALAYLGSRVLHPGRSPWRDADLRALTRLSKDELERRTGLSSIQSLEALDFVLRHRDSEINSAGAKKMLDIIEGGEFLSSAQRDFSARHLGLLLGYDLYDAYIEGRLSTTGIRSFFLTHIEVPGDAPRAYFTMVVRTRSKRLRPRCGSSSR